jgi:hypothetical protein
MKTNATFPALTAGILLLSTTLTAQVTRAYNQNSARSNNAKAFSIYFSPVYTSPTDKQADSLLFRGTGAGVKFGADYFFNAIGLGVVSGFSTANADDALINNFLKRNSIPQDQLVISKSAQQNMYLLLGPTVRWGKAVQLYAHAKGGLFINNGGLVNIQQKGAQRSIYRNEATTKSIYPGFQTGLGIQYSNKAETWSFGFGADYLSTKTQVQNFDLRRGGGVEGLKLSRNISDLMAGISIRYTIQSPRDAASGQASGKRTYSPRDIATGQASGKRTVSPRDIATGQSSGKRSQIATEEITIDESGVHRMYTTDNGQITIDESGVHRMAGANCGPVTQRMTAPDGTVQEMTFACPDDAAAYLNNINGGMPNRISMNVTVPKQTQGATFGEKVNQGMQGPGGNMAGKQTQGATFGEKVNQGLHAAGGALAQGKNIVSGNVSWTTEGSTGIVTNNSVSSVSNLAGGAGGGAAAASYAATGRSAANFNPMMGTDITLYSREAGSGMASGRREKGSGMATGRRQYEPLYNDGSGSSCATCSTTAKLSSVKNNPLYKGNNNSGENPMYKSSGPDQDCDGLAGLDVLLKDAYSGAVVARTTTTACGDFFFANVPDGEYITVLLGTYLSKKGYDYYASKRTDMMGTVNAGQSGIQLRIDMIPTDSVLTAPAAARLITRTKSNQTNERMAATGDDEIWSPRSNIKTIPIFTGDLDGDGTAELLGGALPGGAVISAAVSRQAGGPIGGIIVKGGKNPGGQMRTMTTNEDGEFEFTDLEEGSYTFTVEQKLVINDETFITTGNSRAQDHNSSRSNKSSSIAPDPGSGGGGSGGSKAQDHNSTRSNKTSSVIDNDGDNGDNSNQKGIIKVTASQNSQSLRNGTVKITATQNSQSLRTISVVADMDGDGIYETDVTSKVSDELIMDKDGNVTTPQQKAGISTSRSNIRNKNGFQAVTSTVFTVQGSATVNGKDVPVQAVYKVVEKATSGLKDTLKTQVSIRPAEKYSPTV